MNKNYGMAVLLLLFSLISCRVIGEDEEVFYLKTDNSYLPVYVRGNPDAESYIIWTHGGPGSSGLYYGDIEEISTLHKDYRIVYWDQMGSGGSTGNPDKSDYSVEEFALHQDGVVKAVLNRYNPENLYLLGHSWGGFLVSWYLIADGDEELAAERQGHFNGAILLNPVLDISRSITDGINYIRDEYAPRQIEEGSDVLKWEQALIWYENHIKDNLLLGSDVATHYQYIEDAGGMLVQRDRNDELTAELAPMMVFFSAFHFYDYYNNQNTIRTHMDIADKSLAREDEPNLSSITLPTLFMAGRDDKIAFDYMSEEWFDLLGSHSGTVEERNEYFKMYENCAHAGFLDAPDQFLEDVSVFIESHR